MKLTFGFGSSVQEVEVPERNLMGELHANPVPLGLTGEAEVARALQAPIGAPRLRDTVRPGETIAIVTSDITRPMPTAKVMPALLDELYAGGVRPEDITLVFALGSHRQHTEAERRKLAGERAYSEIQCVDSDPDDCVSYGTTSRGTPVDITRVVAEADRRICLGNIEYHYFAGYSGGAKAIMPGVSTRAAIQANHSRMVLPECCAGNLETNPLRMDIEEAGAMVGIDFILNVVLSEHKKILRAVAGDVTKAHRAGCAFLDTLYRKELAEAADIVLVSQGGAPKDLNLYQTQKALDNAITIVEPFTMDAPKTKEFLGIVKALKAGDRKVLFVLPENANNIFLSSRNLPEVNVITVDEINTYAIMNAYSLVLVDGVQDILASRVNR